MYDEFTANLIKENSQLRAELEQTRAELDKAVEKIKAVCESLDLADEYRLKAGTSSILGVQYALILGQIAVALHHKWRGTEGTK